MLEPEDSLNTEKSTLMALLQDGANEMLYANSICSLFIYGVDKHTRPGLQSVLPFLTNVSSKTNFTKERQIV